MQCLSYMVFISLARYTMGRNRAYTPAGQLTTRDLPSSAVNSFIDGLGEFEVIKTLSGCRVPRCNKDQLVFC